MNPKIVDFLSGFKAVRVINDIAYCATDGGLRIYDVGNRTTPILLSSTLVSQSLNVDIEVKDRYAYVLSGYIFLEKSYITVVDVGNLSKPKVISQFTDLEDGQVTDLLVFDHYLIVANGENIDLIDITKPAGLKRVSRFQVTSPEGGVRSLTFTGKTLFASWENLDDSALVALDLTDVKKLKKIDTYLYPGLNGNTRPAGTIAISNNMLFAAVPTFGFLVFDPAKPDHLVPISKTSSDVFHGIDTLYAEGNFLFVDLHVAGKSYKPGQRDIAVFDISHGSSLPLLNRFTTFASANGMDFDPTKRQAFMGNFPPKGHGFAIFQLSNKNDLDRLIDDVVASPLDVVVQNGIVFIAASQELIASRIVSGKVKIIGKLALSKNAGSIQIQGTTAFVTTSDQKMRSYLNIIDISDPAAMKRLSNYRLNGIQPYQAGNSFAVDGATLYLAANDGLRILDLSNLNSPKQIGFLPIAGTQGAGVVAVDKGIAYIGTLHFDQSANRSAVDFRMINVHDPKSPKLISQKTISFASVVTDIVFEKGFVYLMFAGFGDLLPAGDGQLAIIDVGNSANPSILYSGFTRKGGKGYAAEIAIRGNIAFIADGLEGVTVLSIANKSKPKILETLTTPGHAQGISLDEGNGIHITDGVSYLEYIVN